MTVESIDLGPMEKTTEGFRKRYKLTNKIITSSFTSLAKSNLSLWIKKLVKEKKSRGTIMTKLSNELKNRRMSTITENLLPP